MSMSSHVVGLRPPTEDYKKKLAAYLACEAAGVPAPKELENYFGGICAKSVEPNGMEVDLYRHPAVKPYKGDAAEGFDVDLTKLPEGVTVIRFYNSW
jgi:hypothetical protein